MYVSEGDVVMAEKEEGQIANRYELIAEQLQFAFRDLPHEALIDYKSLANLLWMVAVSGMTFYHHHVKGEPERTKDDDDGHKDSIVVFCPLYGGGRKELMQHVVAFTSEERMIEYLKKKFCTDDTDEIIVDSFECYHYPTGWQHVQYVSRRKGGHDGSDTCIGICDCRTFKRW